MENKNLTYLLKELEEKLDIVLERKQYLEERNTHLERQISILKDTLDEKNLELKNFQNQFKISKIVSSLSGDTQKSTEVKLMINEYLKEIDKCIAYISKH